MQEFFRKTDYLFICLLLIIILIMILFWALSIGTVKLPLEKILFHYYRTITKWYKYRNYRKRTCA